MSEQFNYQQNPFPVDYKLSNNQIKTAQNIKDKQNYVKKNERYYFETVLPTTQKPSQSEIEKFLNPRNNNNQIETSSINLLNGPNCHLGWHWLCPNPRKNNFDNFIGDKFSLVEAFQFNDIDPEIGKYYCNCYNFQVIFKVQVYRKCEHSYAVHLIKLIENGQGLSKGKRRAGRIENNAPAL